MKNRHYHRSIAVEAWNQKAVAFINRLQIALFGLGALAFAFVALTGSETWVYVMAVLMIVALSMFVVRLALGTATLGYFFFLLFLGDREFSRTRAL